MLQQAALRPTIQQFYDSALYPSETLHADWGLAKEVYFSQSITTIRIYAKTSDPWLVVSFLSTYSTV